MDIILFFESFLLLWIFRAGDCIFIETKQGKVRGQTETSRSGRQFNAFYGIPYAEPPIGELRFEDPVPAKNWKGTLDATKLPPACLGSLHEAVFGQEDCLYMNVYSPKIEKSTLLPVMVFIYGGKYMYGHALPNRYGPHYFMDKDIIIITFHYRLGPLGFLSTGDEVMPGNYGLKDFVEVLRWVQKNIDSYGGDKDRVTVAGGSSGGATAAMALISPLTKGLFHRCISQSSVPHLEAGPEWHQRNILKFSSFTKCSRENISSSEQLKSCLKKLSVGELVNENIEKLYTLGTIIPPLIFRPSVENEKIPGAFLVDQPMELLAGNINIPWLLGINSGEGGMSAIYTYLSNDTTFNVVKELGKNYHKYFPQIFGYIKNDIDSKTLKEKTDAVVKRYFANTEISENPDAFAQIITALYSVKLRKAVDRYKGTKYVYYYDHRNEESFDKYYGNPTDKDLGVIHGDELISMFNWSEVIKPVTQGVDLIVSEQVIELWVNFAAYGDPNGKDEKIWNPMKTSEFTYLHIKGGKLKMETELMESENEFWEHIWS